METLGRIIDLARLHAPEHFDDAPVTSYLGSALTTWLERLLMSMGVSSNPVILGEVRPNAILEGAVYVSPHAVVEPGAYVIGPCYIGPEAEVRHGAYVRGSVYIGRRAVVGHATEVKGSVFFDDAKAGHFAYVGDSLLGRDSNLGAGTKLANLKLTGKEISLRNTEGSLEKTGLRKLGAILGDGAQTGCNAVLNPGTVLYPKTAVMPCKSFQGTLEKGIYRG